MDKVREELEWFIAEQDSHKRLNIMDENYAAAAEYEKRAHVLRQFGSILGYWENPSHR